MAGRQMEDEEFFFFQLLIITPRTRSSQAATVTLLLACLLVDHRPRPASRLSRLPGIFAKAFATLSSAFFITTGNCM